MKRNKLSLFGILILFVVSSLFMSFGSVQANQTTPDEVVVSSPSNNVFDPNEFFQNKWGLRVSRDFRDSIMLVAGKTGEVSMKLTSIDLMRSMNDEGIRKELGENYVIEDASEFCSYLANMIEQQPKGEEGNLLTDDHVNIFYVRGKNRKVFVVLVFRVGNRHEEWGLYAVSSDAYMWHPGDRVFFRIRT